VSAIFVRESLSKDYLHKYGIQKNVFLMADPAFVMEPEPVSAADIGFEPPTGAVGLNLSPLMAKFLTNGNMDAWRQKARGIVKALRARIRKPVVLIPHVTAPHDDDHRFMRQIMESLGDDRSDIFLVHKDFGAAQLKFIISKMTCMVAARMHATIAAFSSKIPTVSLGYSIKAEGLNRQIFGHTDYLIRSQDIEPDNVAGRVALTLSRATRINDQLSATIPTIQRMSLTAGDILANRIICQ
jgi:polysaccharide pyruvyl transferase WcaK-like protein